MDDDDREPLPCLSANHSTSRLFPGSQRLLRGPTAAWPRAQDGVPLRKPAGGRAGQVPRSSLRQPRAPRAPQPAALPEGSVGTSERPPIPLAALPPPAGAAERRRGHLAWPSSGSPRAATRSGLAVSWTELNHPRQRRLRGALRINVPIWCLMRRRRGRAAPTAPGRLRAPAGLERRGCSQRAAGRPAGGRVGLGGRVLRRRCAPEGRGRSRGARGWRAGAGASWACEAKAIGGRVLPLHVAPSSRAVLRG